MNPGFGPLEGGLPGVVPFLIPCSAPASLVQFWRVGVGEVI